jgi:hypothetical protein
MRASILLAAAALALSACGDNDQKDNTQTAVDESLTAENIGSNDVTAIDAVTGADANMAADINYMEDPGNGLGPEPPVVDNTGVTVPTPATEPGTKPTTSKRSGTARRRPPPAATPPETASETNSTD